VPGTEIEGREGLVVRLRFDRRQLSAEALIRRVMERYPISDVSIIEPDIDTIVRRIYVEGYQTGAVGTPT
jgi:ABC-2 type transport system ATP-binding protein